MLVKDERALTRYNVAESGCWEWTGATNQYGYGLISLRANGRLTTRATHRHQWICLNGPIPAGQHVMHACDNRLGHVTPPIPTCYMWELERGS